MALYLLDHADEPKERRGDSRNSTQSPGIGADRPATAPEDRRPQTAPPRQDNEKTAAGLFDLPLDCTPGEDCWIVHYVDMDSTTEAKDNHCGALTYDDHKGTDIAIRNRAAMARGVSVIAAADGVVVGTRNDMADRLYDPDDPDPAIDSRECGNGVRLRHEEGLFSQYCHMAQGSIRVRAGESVRRGDPLGQVGLSGKTQFPHLHFNVSRNGIVIDPFTGLVKGSGCDTPPATSLWTGTARAALAYRPVKIYHAGFADRVPPIQDIRNGLFTPLRLTAPPEVLVLWAEFYGIEPGDRLTFIIQDPSGKELHRHQVQLEKRAIRYYAYTGKRFPAATLAPGVYRGVIHLDRQSLPSIRTETMVTIPS